MLIELANTPRDYAWGSTTGIAEFLGTEPSGAPEAELWLGTHPASPARTVRAVPSAEVPYDTLEQWVRADPESLLGDADAAALPILLKVLAAASPLSLQVHPTPEQARAGFAAEDHAGIPVGAAARNYKDPFPKPEIIVAVSETFEALGGFRPAAEVAEFIADLAHRAPAATESLREILADPTRVEEALRWLLSGAPDVAPTVAAVTAAAADAEDGDGVAAATYATVRRIAQHYPGDPGVVIAALLNHVSLRRGEALYAGAGTLHAYLEGVGIELMTASDNVVRGGLTPKHIDTDELVRLLSFEQADAALLEPNAVSSASLVYEPPAPFALWRVDTAVSSETVPLTGPALVIAEGGSTTVSDGDATLDLARGGAAFVSAGTPQVTVSGDAVVWIAVAR